MGVKSLRLNIKQNHFRDIPGRAFPHGQFLLNSEFHHSRQIDKQSTDGRR